MNLSNLIASPNARRTLDAALAIWVACWIGVGIAIGFQVEELRTLTSTVVREGQAVERVAHSVSGLGGLPFVGASVKADAQEAERAGAVAVSGGESSAATIHTLGILLAIAVSFLPSVAVLGLYLPLRAKLSESRRPPPAGLTATPAGRPPGTGSELRRSGA